MNDTKILLTIWPPVQKEWKNIEKVISESFSIESTETYRYSGNGWTNFIIELYKLCYEEYEHHKHPNVEKMIPKAIFMSNFSNDIRLVEIKVENPIFQQIKNGNPYGLKEVKTLKDNLRLRYSQVPRFSVIHSFDTPVRNSAIIDFLESQCEKI